MGVLKHEIISSSYVNIPCVMKKVLSEKVIYRVIFLDM